MRRGKTRARKRKRERDLFIIPERASLVRTEIRPNGARYKNNKEDKSVYGDRREKSWFFLFTISLSNNLNFIFFFLATAISKHR